MHPLLLIIVLWICVGVISLLTAIGLKLLLTPIGPFLAAVIGLVVGVGGVFTVFVTRADRRVWEFVVTRAGRDAVEETIDGQYDDSSTDAKTAE